MNTEDISESPSSEQRKGNTEWLSHRKESCSQSPDLEKRLPRQSVASQAQQDDVWKYARNRCLAIFSKENKPALVPDRTYRGDLLVVVQGLATPIVLREGKRPHREKSSESCYAFVGGASVIPPTGVWAQTLMLSSQLHP